MESKKQDRTTDEERLALADQTIAVLRSRIETQKKLDAQIVARVVGRNVTRAQLAQAFDRVAPKDHWKNPIDAEVVIESDFEMEMIREAVSFFTGSYATFAFVRVVRPIGARDSGAVLYRVRAAGYFAAIGA